VTEDRIVIGSLQSTGLRPTFLHKFEKHGIHLPISLFQKARPQAPDLAAMGRR
jgi:hypothetical protein